MDFKEFSKANLERCESPKGFNHALGSWTTSDWFTATVGELGEAANIAKKLNRVRDGITGNDETPDDDELHDWKPSNRAKSQSAGKSKFWCSKCDAAIIGRIGKCPNCGNIEDKKRKRGIAT